MSSVGLFLHLSPDVLHRATKFQRFPLVENYFGADHSSSNYSFLHTAKGVASIVGGGLTAVVFEKFGSWSAQVR